MRLTLSFAVAIGVMLGCTAAAQAQFSNNRNSSGGTTSAGMFGATTIGGSSALNPGGSSASSNNMGGMGSNGQGAGGTGGLGMGATGAQMQGIPVLQQSAFVGSQNGGNFRSLQGTQGAQGANGMQGQGMTGMQGLGATGLGGRGGAGGITGLRTSLQGNRQNGFNAQQAQRSQQGGSQGQTQIRIPLRLGFQPQAIAAPRFNVNFSDRLAKMPSFQRVGAINVSLEGRTAILRGTVASESDRQLAASLARLEPEVLAVQNELVVGSTETTGEVLPPAPPETVQ